MNKIDHPVRKTSLFIHTVGHVHRLTDWRASCTDVYLLSRAESAIKDVISVTNQTD